MLFEFVVIKVSHELEHHVLSPAGTGYFFISENTLVETRIEYYTNRFAIEFLTKMSIPMLGCPLSNSHRGFGYRRKWRDMYSL
ncbi:hypothetical protein [Desulfosporosinus sp.]|uniref:hypothetical protein n=1 Tax=Desulfosporosinus sp. TaxID=157907 RepID=UPI00261007C3|nr:hypothetical protein [Desulfosporosinus sp.]